jgi:hypothetical protein
MRIQLDFISAGKTNKTVPGPLRRRVSSEKKGLKFAYLNGGGGRRRCMST